MGRRTSCRCGDGLFFRLFLGSSLLLLGFMPGLLAAQATTVAQPEGATPDPLLIVGALPPAPRPDGRIRYTVGRTADPISIDGRLDERAWASAVVIPLPWEVSPAENGPAPIVTECRLTHDAVNLYFACTAEDPDPGAIRAYVVDRDAIGSHDRIVLTLDPFNDQRRAFQFGVSALGVQSDAVFAQQGTSNPNRGPGAADGDPAWDAIWSSAGVITENGFVIEAAIPFRSLRFPAAEHGEWGLYVTRWWPRSSNVEVRSATWDPSNSCLLCQANVVAGIEGGTPGANVQFTPTLTGSRTERRGAAPNSPLVAEPSQRDIGLDAQWGITSDLTLNLTGNPDFSQVEADVAQLDVNNRFALFFPEKRPFFLEGADFFGTPIQAVFTRSIADPSAGAKLTGKLGDNALGFLIAQDRSPNLLIPGSQFSSSTRLDSNVTTAITRFRRDVGSASTVGALYTGRESADYYNRVGGADAFFRPVESMTLQAQILRSDTEYPAGISDDFDQPEGPFSGNAAQLRAQWSTRAWMFHGNLQRIDPNFRADAGFLTQAGVSSGNANLTRRFWGGRDRWFTQLRLEGGTWRTKDFEGNQINGGLWFGIGYDGPGQTSIGIFPNLFMKEHFAGTTYEGMRQLFFNLRTSPSGSLSMGLWGNIGDAIDFPNERLGSEIGVSPSIDFRFGRNLEASVQHTFQRLRNQGAPVYTANLSQLRTVYNFSTRSFVRAIVQYRRTDRDPAQHVHAVDRRSEKFFVQFLYAYKLNPQTVFFLGYGQDGSRLTDETRLRTPYELQGRAFFLKLGYAWRP